jgi:hypothetical protein
MHDRGEDHHLDVRMKDHKLRNDEVKNRHPIADCGARGLHEPSESTNAAFQIKIGDWLDMDL